MHDGLHAMCCFGIGLATRGAMAQISTDNTDFDEQLEIEVGIGDFKAFLDLYGQLQFQILGLSNDLLQFNMKIQFQNFKIF